MANVAERLEICDVGAGMADEKEESVIELFVEGAGASNGKVDNARKRESCQWMVPRVCAAWVGKVGCGWGGGSLFRCSARRVGIHLPWGCLMVPQGCRIYKVDRTSGMA